MSLPDDQADGIDVTEGLRERLLLDEQVHLVTSAQATAEPSADLASYARHRWIAGCDRCRANLLRQCALAGFTPKIAFTTDDYVAVQALVAADLGVSILPALAPARRTASRDQDRAAHGRPQVRVRGAVRRPAGPTRGEPAPGGAPHGGRAAAAHRRKHRSATVSGVNPGQPPSAEASRQQLRGEPEPIPGQLTLPGMPSPVEASGGQATLPGLEFTAADGRDAAADGRAADDSPA